MKYFFRALAHPLLAIFGPNADFYLICALLGLVDMIIVAFIFKTVRARLTTKPPTAAVVAENPSENERKPSWLEISPLIICVFIFTEALINIEMFSGDLMALNFGLIIFLIWAGFVWGLWCNVSKKFSRVQGA